MHRNVMLTHVGRLQQMADDWSKCGKEGGEEVAFLLLRAARLATAVANDQPLPAEEPKPDVVAETAPG